MNNQFFHDELEHVDASIFSSDTLDDHEHREELKFYLGRWQRALEEKEKELADAELKAECMACEDI